MPDVTLTEAQQSAVRALVATEAVPGTAQPPPRVLDQVAVLIPCDGIDVAYADRQTAGGTPPVGLRWVSREPERMRPFLAPGTVDALLVGYRHGPDHVVQLTMGRRRRPFTSRDVAVLRMLEPVLCRLLGERPAPHLPAELTVQERRVLRLLAAGCSNAQIAERLGIASCTVRKHLEHAFPKLGVTNRLAAALAFEGQQRPGTRNGPPG